MENFHGFIAIELENIASQNDIKLNGEKVTADIIETDYFTETMLKVLESRQIKNSSFYQKCEEYAGKSALEIPFEKALELFNEFKRLLKNKAGLKYTLDNNQAYTTCPLCGQDITQTNDALNGFCKECTQKGLVD